MTEERGTRAMRRRGAEGRGGRRGGGRRGVTQVFAATSRRAPHMQPPPLVDELRALLALQRNRAEAYNRFEECVLLID